MDNVLLEYSLGIISLNNLLFLKSANDQRFEVKEYNGTIVSSRFVNITYHNKGFKWFRR